MSVAVGALLPDFAAGSLAERRDCVRGLEAVGVTEVRRLLRA